MADLLPCPFCGGKAERIDIEDGDNAGGSCVICTACNASGNVEFGFKENFVSNWNRRAPIAGWRDMKDAPKDGTRILLGCFATELRERLGHTAVDYWHSLIAGDNFDGWGRFNAAIWPPTHWMPLPAAPVDGGEDAH